MKKFLLSIALLCSLCINAQTTITTHSSCDSDCDGEVTVVDATNTVNKVIKKEASETQVVTAEQLNTLLNEVNTKLTDIQNRLQYLEKAGVYTYPFADGHEYVDLGLPSGTLWATCNIGASSPEESGDYFAWGETTGYSSGKTSFNWASYKYGASGAFTKYCVSSDYGTVDNITQLDIEDDAANVNWGNDWRIPTDEEWAELRSECTMSWTTLNGIYGEKVTGPNENFIFLPAAGYHTSVSFNDYGSTGKYWSSSLDTDYSENAWYVRFDSLNSINEGSHFRYVGYSVRPVCK